MTDWHCAASSLYLDVVKFKDRNLATNFDTVKIVAYIAPMSQDNPTAKKPYHHGDLKAALLSCAVTIIREEGEEALTMRHLAAAAGVSRTAPYHHFSNKQGLLSAIAEEGFRKFDEEVFAPLRKRSSAGAQERLRGFVTAWVTFATENPEYYNLMYGPQVWLDGAASDGHAEGARRDFQNNIADMRYWQERGLVNPDMDPRRFAQVLWAALHGLSRLVIDGIYMKSDFSEAMCNGIADMLWREMQAA